MCICLAVEFNLSPESLIAPLIDNQRRRRCRNSDDGFISVLSFSRYHAIVSAATFRWREFGLHGKKKQKHAKRLRFSAASSGESLRESEPVEFLAVAYFVVGFKTGGVKAKTKQKNSTKRDGLRLRRRK